MISRRHVIAASAGAPLMFHAASAFAQAGPHTIDELNAPPRDRDAALSPDGKKIAVASTTRVGEDKDDSRITIIPADAPDKTLSVLPLGDREVQNVAWASDTRLLITLLIPLRRARAELGTRLARGGDVYERAPPKARRVLAIDIDGKNSVILFDDGTGKLKEVHDLGAIVDLTPNDPDHILMRAANYNTRTYCLYKVDIHTGKTDMVEQGGLKTWTWMCQDGAPVVRYDYNQRGTVQTLYVRPPGATEWKFFRQLRKDEFNKQEFTLVGTTPEPGVLLAAAREGDAGTLALRKFDLRTLTLGETLASRPDRDVEDALVTRRGQFLAAGFVDDRRTYQFGDPKMAAVYRGLNKYLGDTCNLRIFDVSDDGNRFLAWARGPREPGTIYFYDRAAKRFDGVGQAAPQLVPERLATMQTLAIKARDGLPLTAYLTIPLAPGPRPLVVLPHGGPELRDTYDYDAFAQVLAAQGWLVLQPNFRGSGGYGKAFADAGRKHWGDQMQEDIEDAVAQVIASGRADPNRIAICGGSYGGYAALMGAVRRPELYKAVVSIAGVSDLMESIAATKTDDGADAPSYFYWLETIGDPAKDRAMMEAASPALHADRISAPVLLIHGVEDTIVPVKQSRIMNGALKSAGKSVQLLELKGAGHRDLQPEEWEIIYKRSVAHIAKAFA